MIRVTVELIPFGTGKPRKIGEMRIANDGTGTPKVGHYVANVRGKTRRIRTARVINYPRQRLHVWHLIKRALEEVYG